MAPQFFPSTLPTTGKKIQRAVGEIGFIYEKESFCLHFHSSLLL